MKNMLIYYILTVITIILYLQSFFPLSENYAQKHEIPTKLQDIEINLNEIYDSSVDKLVIVVIDALRYDFINPENTPNLMKLIKDDGCLSLVKVESPTVTLPRIKALTTGSVPQFIDVVLNLLDIESAADSIIHQAINYEKQIVFYGDDTWLKLYPDMFVRSEGTSSFYVYDYTEVDDNVTRNVREELQREDWDIMILHYLGLDHIGHVTGPFSPLVQPKLQEMDEIIKEIHNATINDRRLVVVTGDHGMKDSGGHGGTTYSETRVPFLLLGQPCSNDLLSQSDIPLVLSAFMGLPFPSNSIGKISSKLLSSFTIEKLLFTLHYNSLFLANKTNICMENNKKASDMYYTFLKDGNSSMINLIISLYEHCLNEMRSYLTHRSVTQDTFYLIFCICVLIFCLISSLLATLNYERISEFNVAFILLLVLSSFIYNWNRFFVITFSLISILFFINDLSRIIKLLFRIEINLKTVLLILLNILYSVSMIASSFIEEEHQTWYFFFVTFLVVNSMKSRDIYSIGVLVLFRFIRKLNQTGDKWAAEPDISQWLLLKENYLYFHALYVLSLIWTAICCVKLFCKNNLNKFVTLCIIILIYTFKMHFSYYATAGQIIWCLILINFILTFSISTDSLLNTWILIICLLYRPQNIILIPFCIYASVIFSKQIDSMLILTISHLWLGNVLYFCQGHSNSLASIDIAAGYIGLKDYKPVYVLTQIICNMYSMPILANLLLLRHYNDLSMWNIFGLFRILLIVVTFLVAFIQRHHLFIWSVFAPKILLESSHTLILLIQILIHHVLLYINIFKNKKLNLLKEFQLK